MQEEHEQDLHRMNIKRDWESRGRWGDKARTGDTARHRHMKPRTPNKGGALVQSAMPESAVLASLYLGFILLRIRREEARLPVPVMSRTEI